MGENGWHGNIQQILKFSRSKGNPQLNRQKLLLKVLCGDFNSKYGKKLKGFLLKNKVSYNWQCKKTYHLPMKTRFSCRWVSKHILKSFQKNKTTRSGNGKKCLPGNKEDHLFYISAGVAMTVSMNTASMEK